MSSRIQAGRRHAGGPEAVGDRLQGLVGRLAARRRIPHVVLCVERGDGTLRWSGAAGEAHPGGAPMRPETPYFIASVTKLYIAACILQLHEQELVDLEAPMAAYVPADRVAGLHRLDGVDRTGEVTSDTW